MIKTLLRLCDIQTTFLKFAQRWFMCSLVSAVWLIVMQLQVACLQNRWLHSHQNEGCLPTSRLSSSLSALGIHIYPQALPSNTTLTRASTTCAAYTVLLPLTQRLRAPSSARSDHSSYHGSNTIGLHHQVMQPLTSRKRHLPACVVVVLCLRAHHTHSTTHLEPSVKGKDVKRDFQKNQGGPSQAVRPMTGGGRPVTGFARPGTSTRPTTSAAGKPGTALEAALKGARPGTSLARPVTSSGR